MPIGLRLAVEGTGERTVGGTAVPAQPIDRLLLVRPDGYLAWVGTAEEFPAWVSEYFGWPNRRAALRRAT